ncbi:hypothetical protein [Spirosoma fluviale]|uniref:hypothetical protein n=1 Tax=Spirosoma fluviale TaxID=1597977 RepID=UPI000BE3014A|nr:hypothetical protein [Spirosoma fluviale]
MSISHCSLVAVFLLSYSLTFAQPPGMPSGGPPPGGTQRGGPMPKANTDNADKMATRGGSAGGNLAALAGTTGKVTYTPIEGAGHGGPQFEAPENLETVFIFLDKHLK